MRILVFTKSPKVCSMVLGCVFRFCCSLFGRALMIKQNRKPGENPAGLLGLLFGV